MCEVCHRHRVENLPLKQRAVCYVLTMSQVYDKNLLLEQGAVS